LIDATNKMSGLTEEQKRRLELRRLDREEAKAADELVGDLEFRLMECEELVCHRTKNWLLNF
jgi:hypothetical protein